MSAHHFFTDASSITATTATLHDGEARHAAKSLRVQIGEQITVADGTGRVAAGIVSHVGDEVIADVSGIETREAPRPEITLVQALTKGEKFAEIVEKACEVGVRRIVPFVAERTIVRWDDPKRERAQHRWQTIARSAAKQSRSPWIAEVASIADDPVAAIEGGAIVLHESASRRLREVLTDEAPARLAIVVGPEGGLSDDEVAALASCAPVVTLGPQILRTETAGLVAASIVGFRYGSVG